MKKLVCAIAVGLTIGCMPCCVAGEKGDVKKGETVKGEGIEKALTPTGDLIAEYYKIIAQIRQYEQEIKRLEDRLNRLDAVIRYQKQVERKLKADKK